MSFALMNILPLCRCRFGPAHSAGVLHFMFSERRLIQLLIFLCPCTFPESASVGCGIQSPTLRKLQNPPLKAFMQTTPSAEIPWPDLSMASSASKKEGKMTSSFGSFPIQWGGYLRFHSDLNDRQTTCYIKECENHDDILFSIASHFTFGYSDLHHIILS